MTATRTRDQGKTSFIKELLVDNPKATHKIVNEAWTSAGMDGAISETLVKTVRADLGLTGNTRKATASKAGRKATAAAPVKNARAGELRRVIVEAEADIDRLLFKLMGVSGLSEIEDALRAVRRKLVLRSHKA